MSASQAVIWDVVQYAKAIRVTPQAALRRLKWAHAEASEDGVGGWLWRTRRRGKWQINMLMLARWKPGMLVAPSLEERVIALEESDAAMGRKFDRLAASLRYVDASVRRISSRPPPTQVEPG